MEVAKVKTKPDPNFVRACTELGGTVTERVFYDLDTGKEIFEGYQCNVKTEERTYKFIPKIADVLKKYRPTGFFRIDFSWDGEMEFKTEKGNIKNFYAWYPDLENIKSIEVDLDEDFKEWIEDNFVGRKLSDDEWRRIMDEASRYYTGKREEENINEAWTGTSEWVDYEIINELGLDMELSETAYGGVYPRIRGKNVNIPPEKFKKLAKVFKDFHEVRYEEGNGNGLATDLHLALERGQEYAWMDAIKDALRKLGLLKKE